jgi:hypothetical protein
MVARPELNSSGADSLVVAFAAAFEETMNSRTKS